MVVLFGVLAHMVVLFLIFWVMSILFSIVVGSLWKLLIFVSIWFYPKSQCKVSETGIKVTITYSNNYASFLFRPLLLLPSIFPSISIFPSESVLWIKWQRIRVSASAENSNEFLGLKGMTEDEIIGWHHQLNGHEFEQGPGVSDGQGSLACCSPQVAKSQTRQSNWTDPRPVSHIQCSTGETQNQSHICTGRVCFAVQNSWNEIRQFIQVTSCPLCECGSKPLFSSYLHFIGM